MPGVRPNDDAAFHQGYPDIALLNSSNYLTKSYSTLSEPASAPSTPSCSTNPINPKVLTRTQSADPRLNPQKELPPATPKRKLSINEYRKRKQLSSTTEKPKTEEPEKSDTVVDPIKSISADEKAKNGVDIKETKETGKC